MALIKHTLTGEDAYHKSLIFLGEDVAKTGEDRRRRIMQAIDFSWRRQAKTGEDHFPHTPYARARARMRARTRTRGGVP